MIPCRGEGASFPRGDFIELDGLLIHQLKVAEPHTIDGEPVKYTIPGIERVRPGTEVPGVGTAMEVSDARYESAVAEDAARDG